MEKAKARKEAAADLFKTLRAEVMKPASKRRQKKLIHATAMAALLYLDARNALKKNETE